MKSEQGGSIFSNKIDIEDINIKAAILYMLFVIAFLLLFIAFKK